MIQQSLAGHSGVELHEMLGQVPAFHIRQISAWIVRGIQSFDDMTDLSVSLRTDLAGQFSLYSSMVSATVTAPEGTVKMQITLCDGAAIEAVLLTDTERRHTACLSTQAGCPLGCVFCKTGSIGFLRNLTGAEIVEQFLHLRSIQPDIANIVIMGMGEPLLNEDGLYHALSVLRSDFGISPRRITVSTAGIVEGIRTLAERGTGVRLALSLTTANAALREALMPVARHNPLPQIKEALRYYQSRQKHRLTLEAVLLGGINTGSADAQALADFAEGLEVIINVIPWNPVPGMTFAGTALKSPTTAEVSAFIVRLEQLKLNVTRRFSRGQSIAGACGQLGLAQNKP